MIGVETLQQPRTPDAARRSPRRLWSAAADWLHAHETKLWWLHSVWALVFGIGVMWLGSRNFTYLRVALIHVSFILATSFVLPYLLRSTRLSRPWRSRVRLVINYFNKNFYQQLLFFILPIYWLSTTAGSLNMIFVVVLGVCALLSTMDLIYDRHLAMRRALTALFFAFTVFAGAAAALPILWGFETVTALWLAAAVAAAGSTTLVISEHRLDWQRTWFVGGLIVLGLALLVEYGRPFIPPAPLRLASASFGTGVDLQGGPSVTAPLAGTPLDHHGRLYVVTAIYAPLGLHDRVRHVWYRGHERTWTSRWYDVSGGRAEGYRLWTSQPSPHVWPDAMIRVDVETEGGQLIGRARLRASR